MNISLFNFFDNSTHPFEIPEPHIYVCEDASKTEWSVILWPWWCNGRDWEESGHVVFNTLTRYAPAQTDNTMGIVSWYT